MAPGIFAIISAVKVVACSIYVQEVAFTFGTAILQEYILFYS
jgi:hypothetical protein